MALYKSIYYLLLLLLLFIYLFKSNGGETEFPRFYERKVICFSDNR